MRSRRSTRLSLLALLPLTIALASCRGGQTMWGPCTPDMDPTGTDGTYVLLCRDGTWTAVMTIAEYAAMLRGEHVDIAPLPRRPDPTTTTTSTTSTTSTTTTSTTSTTTTSTTSTTSTTIPAPTLTSITPSSGPTAGGDVVTLTGTGLAGTTGVTFGGTEAAAFTVVDDSTVTAVTPAGSAGAVDVVVTTAGGSTTATSGYSYVNPPAVFGVSPNSGAAGTTVIVTGIGFTGATAVWFGDVPASAFTVDSDTRITAVAPVHANGPAAVTATGPGGTGSGGSGSVFSYLDNSQA